MSSNPNTPTARLNAIEPRLDAIEQALGIRPAPVKVPLLKRLWDSVFAHPAASTAATLLVFVVGIAATRVKGWLDDTVDHRIENTLKERGGVLEKLDKLQTMTEETNTTLKTLQPFIQDLVRHQFDNASKLTPQALQGGLPAVTDLIQVANTEGVRVEPQLSADLSKNLLRVPNVSPGYWQAVSQLISYRSVPGKNSPRDEPCSKFIVNIDKETGPKGEDIDTHFEASDCTFDLGDNPNFRGGGYPQTRYLLLRNVRIRYNGGSMSDLPPTIVFDHCTFDLHINNQPPIAAQRLTNALLASADLSTLSYKTPGHPL